MSGDRLAISAIIAGSAIAFVAVRLPLVLVIGVATAAAGVLLALRGDRPPVTPRLLGLALAITIVTVAAHGIFGVLADWEAGRALSEGAPLGWVQASLRRYEQLRATCRSLAIFSSLGLLIGAIVTRAGTPRGSGKQKGSG